MYPCILETQQVRCSYVARPLLMKQRQPPTEASNKGRHLTKVPKMANAPSWDGVTHVHTTHTNLDKALCKTTTPTPNTLLPRIALQSQHATCSLPWYGFHDRAVRTRARTTEHTAWSTPSLRRRRCATYTTLTRKNSLNKLTRSSRRIATAIPHQVGEKCTVTKSNGFLPHSNIPIIITNNHAYNHTNNHTIHNRAGIP